MNEQETLQTQKTESKSSYFIIYDWMIQELHLKGSELLIYAIIYSYCESGNKAFNGSLSLLSKKSGIEHRQLIRVLQRLVVKGFLAKEIAMDRGIALPIYRVVTKCHHQCQKVTTTSDKMSPKIKDSKKEEIELYKYNSLSKKESKEREQNVSLSSNGNDTETDTKPKRQTFDDILNSWVAKNIQEHRRDEVKSLLVEWLKIRKASKVPNTNKSIELNLDKLIKSSKQSSLDLISYLKEVITRGYAVFYVINHNRFTTTSPTVSSSPTPEGHDDLGIGEVTEEDIQAIKDQFGFS